jgi:excisionase family DNA binding protein
MDNRWISAFEAYSINDTARALSLGRTSIYAMIADGRLEAFKLGRRTLVKAESVRRLVDAHAEPVCRPADLRD